MKKYFYLLILLFIFSPNKISAQCEIGEYSKLSKIANNVNVSYTYNKEKNSFTLILTNITKEIVVSYNDVDYMEDIEMKLDNIKSGNHKIDIYATDKNCVEDVLTTKNIFLPYYNKYSENKECEGNNSTYCNRWLKSEIDYKTWYSNITNLKQEEKIETIDEKRPETYMDKVRDFILNIYVNYYYIILPTLIIILCIMIYLRDRKDQII